MFNQYPNQQGGFPSQRPSGGHNNYYSSIKGLAITCAIICTLLLGPLLGKWTEPYIMNLIIDIYGYEWVAEGVWIWKGLMLALIFFITRAFVVAAIVALGIGLAQRWPVLLSGAM